jgi:hypothetical protein
MYGTLSPWRMTPTIRPPNKVASILKVYLSKVHAVAKLVSNTEEGESLDYEQITRRVKKYKTKKPDLQATFALLEDYYTQE